MPRDALEPVYRLISSSRYMEAIHVINKLLKKQPNFQIAKVWKCEALYGLGNVTESEELMANILEQMPTDNRTLESIADFYRARGNYSKLVELYESALKHDPNDENWRKSLFECCGLSGDYKKQQQQALLLYKQCPRMLFYCMSVVCLLQQVENNPLASELAERMMTKQASAGNVKSKNEILLLVNVFEARGKYEEALDWVNKNTSELESLISISEKRVELLMRLNRWPEAIIELKQILKDKPDSWSHYKQYLESVLQLEALGGTADDPDVEDSQERAYRYLAKQCEDHSSIRGPFLAILELMKLTFSDVDSRQFFNKIVAYFERFGTKGISVFDLRSYISLLPESYHDELMRMISDTNCKSLDALEIHKRMGTAKHVSFLQLKMYLGYFTKLDVDGKIQICNNLLRCYEATEITDERREQYLALEAVLFRSLFYETGDAEHLISMVCQLEEALSQGPCIFVVQMLLLQFYFALGATKAAKKIYEQLRIQSVQVDTLHHIFIVGLSSTGHFSIALDMWEYALRILQQCTAESLEALVWCYRAGLFHRVEEFTRCARRFQKTLTAPLLRGEKTYLDIVMAEPGKAEQLMSRTRLTTDWDSCVDNRDVNVLSILDPISQRINASDSFQELKIFCKLRDATLCCVSTAVTYGKTRQDSDFKKLKDNIEDVKKLEIEAMALRIPIHCRQTRLQKIAQKPLVTLVEKLVDSEAGSAEKVSSILKQTADDTNEIILTQNAKNPRECLEAIVTQLEMLALVTSVCVAARTGFLAPQRRRTEQVVRMLLSCWTQLESSLTIQLPQRPPDVTSSFRVLVEEKLRENYQAAIDDLKKVIRRKVAYLHKSLNS